MRNRYQTRIRQNLTWGLIELMMEILLRTKNRSTKRISREMKSRIWPILTKIMASRSLLGSNVRLMRIARSHHGAVRQEDVSLVVHASTVVRSSMTFVRTTMSAWVVAATIRHAPSLTSVPNHAKKMTIALVTNVAPMDGVAQITCVMVGNT